MPNLKLKSIQVLKSLLNYKSIQLISFSKSEKIYLKHLDEIKVLLDEITILKKELKERGI